MIASVVDPRGGPPAVLELPLEATMWFRFGQLNGVACSHAEKLLRAFVYHAGGMHLPYARARSLATAGYLADTLACMCRRCPRGMVRVSN